jgi:hypothetical protein
VTWGRHGAIINQRCNTWYGHGTDPRKSRGGEEASGSSRHPCGPPLGHQRTIKIDSSPSRCTCRCGERNLSERMLVTKRRLPRWRSGGEPVSGGVGAYGRIQGWPGKGVRFRWPAVCHEGAVSVSGGRLGLRFFPRSCRGLLICTFTAGSAA